MAPPSAVTPSNVLPSPTSLLGPLVPSLPTASGLGLPLFTQIPPQNIDSFHQGSRVPTFLGNTTRGLDAYFVNPFGGGVSDEDGNGSVSSSSSVRSGYTTSSPKTSLHPLFYLGLTVFCLGAVGTIGGGIGRAILADGSEGQGKAGIVLGAGVGGLVLGVVVMIVGGSMNPSSSSTSLLSPRTSPSQQFANFRGNVLRASLKSGKLGFSF